MKKNGGDFKSEIKKEANEILTKINTITVDNNNSYVSYTFEDEINKTKQSQLKLYGRVNRLIKKVNGLCESIESLQYLIYKFQVDDIVIDKKTGTTYKIKELVDPKKNNGCLYKVQEIIRSRDKYCAYGWWEEVDREFILDTNYNELEKYDDIDRYIEILKNIIKGEEK